MYEKVEVNGETLWFFKYDKRSKINPRIRAQRKRENVRLKDEKAARKYYEKLIEEVNTEIGRKEAQGFTWLELVQKWDLVMRKKDDVAWASTTQEDHFRRIMNYTKGLLRRPVYELVESDLELELRKAEIDGASPKLIRAIVYSVDLVYRWGMRQKYILGKDDSICRDLLLSTKKRKTQEKEPLILTMSETRDFFSKAEAANHEWYPIWFVAAYTGMRSGELNALRKQKIDMVDPKVARRLDQAPRHELKNYGSITVDLSFNKRLGGNGPTKTRWWRTVPLNSKLYWFFDDYLENDFGADEDGERVFPKINAWDNSQQSQIIREFCRSHDLKEVTFHTLRACFATLMAASGVDRETIKKIGGWKEGKTLDIYIRKSGIEVAGKTEVLDFCTQAKSGLQEVPSNVVSIFGKT